MTKYKVITLPLAEEDIADQTDYIAFGLRNCGQYGKRLSEDNKQSQSVSSKP